MYSGEEILLKFIAVSIYVDDIVGFRAKESRCVSTLSLMYSVRLEI